MIHMRFALYSVLAAACVIAMSGCGGSADPDRPISEVKAEAASLDVDGLRAMAAKYKDAIVAKQGDMEKLAAKLKEIPLTEMLGEEAKDLKGEVESLTKSVKALKQRFEVYYDKLKTEGADLTGLDL